LIKYQIDKNNKDIIYYNCLTEGLNAQIIIPKGIKKGGRKMRNKIYLLVAVLVGATIILYGANASAVHKSGSFACQKCHAMHGTTSWNSEANADLLRYTKGAEFCLQCHEEDSNNDDPVSGETSPNVAKLSANGKPSTTIGAGGYFYGMTQMPSSGTPYTSDNAHDMDPTGPTPPVATASITGMFWCTNCHDQHGVNNADGDKTGVSGTTPTGGSGTYTIDTFRNLKRGDTDIDGTETSMSDTAYKAGIADFCIQCHDSYVKSGGNHHRYHPVEVGINTELGTLYYEFGMDDTDNDTSQPIIKPQDPSGDDDPTNATATNRDGSNDDQPTCLTCHYAHGGPYTDLLRWDYGNSSYTWSDPNTDTVGADPTGDASAGCQMCHNM
jgi:predicted CXXCH cytochrome family protein